MSSLEIALTVATAVLYLLGCIPAGICIATDINRQWGTKPPLLAVIFLVVAWPVTIFLLIPSPPDANQR